MFSNGDADSLANSIKKTTLEDRADFPLNNAQEGHTLKVEAKLGGETQLEHVFIKNLAGKVTRLDVDQSTTVLELKQKIEAEMKIKTRSQQIFLKNIGLKDDHAKLRNFNIKNGDELNLIASKKSALQQWKEEHPDDAQQSWTQKKYAELIARELPFLQKDEKYCFGPSGRTNHSGQEIFDLIVLGQKGTPYEGGLFWIDVAIPDDFPFKAPLLKFQAVWVILAIRMTMNTPGILQSKCVMWWKKSLRLLTIPNQAVFGQSVTSCLRRTEKNSMKGLICGQENTPHSDRQQILAFTRFT
mmetsp:Transcript_2817/g.4103  ORF Transcript_2817/g.4103 Transcript_2817/m.4103 type:complete len:299 (-) Transcript_2817:190-1086(-)